MKKKAIESNSNHVPHVSHQTLHEEGEQYLNKDGEVYTTIYGTECRVCDLVWAAFTGEIPEGYTIVHIDGDKKNNRLDNLKLERL